MASSCMLGKDSTTELYPRSVLWKNSPDTEEQKEPKDKDISKDSEALIHKKRRGRKQNLVGYFFLKN